MSTESRRGRCYGLMAEFASAAEILAAVRASRGAGYERVEAYTPYPVDGLADALGLRKSPIPLLTLIGGLLGAAAGWLLQWYSAVIDYPLNAGGRPLYSWPAFIPSTIESAFSGLASAPSAACSGSRVCRACVIRLSIPRISRASRAIGSFSASAARTRCSTSSARTRGSWHCRRFA